MKKALLIAVLTAAFAFNAHAQLMQFGAKGGANFATLVGDDAGDAKMRTSFHIGGVAEFMLSDKFSFQPELLYSSQGAKSEYEDMGITVKEKLIIDYLNLPLVGKFYVTDGLSLELGPQIGFLLSAKAKVEADDISIEEDAKEYLKEIDFGAALGVGYKLPSGLFFDARYNLGLSSIEDIPDQETNVKNSVIQVSLGFMF